MIRSRTLLPAALFAWASCALPIFAQSKVWLVDPVVGSFLNNLEVAISLASDGDVLLLSPGDYAPSGLSISNKSLTLLADEGADVRFLSTFSVDSLAADQRVVLRGCSFRPVAVPAGTGGPGLRLSDCDGAVWITDCAMMGSSDVALSVTECDQVVVSGSDLEGSGFGSQGGPFVSFEGLYLENSSVQLFDSQVTGFVGGTASTMGVFSGDGAPAVVQSGGELVVGGSALIGGVGGGGSTVGSFCLDPGSGGDAIFFEGGLPAAVRLTDASLQPGSAGPPASGCPAAPTLNGLDFAGPGATQANVSFLPGPARLLQLDSPVREGESAAVHFEANPGEVLFAVFSGAPAVTPVLTQALDLLVTQPFVITLLGVSPASGQLDLPLGPVSIQSSLEALNLFVQGAAIDPVSLGAFLSSPSDLTVLDSSF